MSCLGGREYEPTRRIAGRGRPAAQAYQHPGRARARGRRDPAQRRLPPRPAGEDPARALRTERGAAARRRGAPRLPRADDRLRLRGSAPAGGLPGAGGDLDPGRGLQAVWPRLPDARPADDRGGLPRDGVRGDRFWRRPGRELHRRRGGPHLGYVPELFAPHLRGDRAADPPASAIKLARSGRDPAGVCAPAVAVAVPRLAGREPPAGGADGGQLERGGRPPGAR